MNYIEIIYKKKNSVKKLKIIKIFQKKVLTNRFACNIIAKAPLREMAVKRCQKLAEKAQRTLKIKQRKERDP